MEHLIYAVSFCLAASNYIVSVALPLFLTQHRGAGPFLIGLAGLAGNLGYTVVAWMCAHRPVPRRRLPVFVPASLGIGLCYLALAFLPLPLAVACLILNGAFYGRFWPSVQNSLRLDGPSDDSGRFNIWWSGGVIAGSFVAGALYGVHWMLPFLAAGLLGTGSSAAAFARRSLFRPPADAPAHAAAPAVRSFTARFVRKVRALSFVHFTAVGAILFLFPRRGLDLGVAPGIIGAAVGIMLGARFLTFAGLRKAPVLGRPAVAWSVYAAAAASCLLIGFCDVPAVHVAGMVLLGIAGAFSYHNSFLLHMEAGFPMEIHEAIIGAGFVAGPLLAGTIGQFCGLRVAFTVIGAAVALAGIAVETLWREETRTTG